jgi:YggT family protein
MHVLSERLCAPFLQPFRRWIPLVGGVDLSPLALLLLLQMLGIVLAQLQMSWMY